MLFKNVTFSVFHLERSSEVRLLQPKNMHIMFVTFIVFQPEMLEIPADVRFSQVSNT